MGHLLETHDGLMADWAVVKRVCKRFDKRREWGDKDSSRVGTIAARKLEGPPPVRREETRGWLKRGSTSTSVAKARLEEELSKS